MNKAMVAVGMLTIFILIGSPAFAMLVGNENSNSGGFAGKSNVFHLYLYEKDSVSWDVVEGGAWGKMTYNLEKGKFVFNGHGLEAGQDYTLINFARVDSEWPATIHVLGPDFVTADADGNVHLMGTYPYADLDLDTTPDSGSDEGYKIWLVLYDDIVAGKLQGWTPEEYLFEYELIPILSAP